MVSSVEPQPSTARAEGLKAKSAWNRRRCIAILREFDSKSFTCPNCQALYQVVKVEAGPETVSQEVPRAQVCVAGFAEFEIELIARLSIGTLCGVGAEPPFDHYACLTTSPVKLVSSSA
jgi:hypothetical protein